MAAKDKWIATYRCPQCGTEKKAEVSENDYPFTPPERTVVIDAPFFTKQDRYKNDQVWCGNCGVMAE